MYYEALLWLVLTLCATWIVLFSLNPNFVRVVDCDDIYPRPGAPPDPVKCLIFAVVVGLATAIACVFIFRERAGNASSEFYMIRDANLTDATVGTAATVASLSQGAW